MFKGTNKVWKGLALALALCMLPTVALATSVNTVSVALETASSEDAVKVTVTIGDATKALADTDVTILALRKATTYADTPALNTPGAADTSLIPAAAETLKKQVTYIDQETSDENGKVTFEFIPASTDAAYSSKYIDIYVGGADVAAPQVLTVERALAAPTLTLKSSTWMAGDDVVLTLGGSVASDATALAAWAADVTAKFTVSAGEAIADVADVETWTIADGELVIPYTVVAGRTITGITFESGSYATKTVEGITALKETPKTAGTLGNLDILEGTAVELTITGEEWAAALGSALEGAADVNTIVTVEDGTLTGASVVGDKLVLEGLTAGTEGTKTYKVTAAVPFYTVPAKATVVISTAAYKDKVELEKKSYSAVYGPEIIESEKANLADQTDLVPTLEEQRLYGKAIVTFDTLGTNGTTITWDTADEGADELEAGKYELTRPATGSGDKSREYIFTAMVGDFTVENIKVTVSECGLAGVKVSASVVGGAAKSATVKLMSGTSEVASLAMEGTFAADLPGATPTNWKFTAEGVAAGTYDLVIERAGYLKYTESVTIADTDIDLGAKTMFFGNNRGVLTEEPDTVIDLADYDAIVAAVLVSSDLKYDSDGNGVVDLADYEALVANVGKTESSR